MSQAINRIMGWVIDQAKGFAKKVHQALESGKRTEERSEQEKQPIVEPQRSFELVEVLSPYGKSIRCAKRGLIYIPMGKIEIFGTGKVKELTSSFAYRRDEP